MSGRIEIPREVLAAYGWLELHSTPASSGLINDTFIIAGHEGPLAVLQRQHPVFGAEVNIDLEAITDHLAERGMTTPRLIRTRSGQRCVESDARIWRAISFIEGRTLDQVPEAAAARSAGEVVGRFHQVLSDFDGSFEHLRVGVHDTAAHTAKLEGLRGEGPLEEIDPLADDILEACISLPDMAGLPARNAHGDLKISNILFEPESWNAICLIDLDTCGKLPVAYELGDALRSWGNLAGEDTDAPTINVGIATAALEGYAAGSSGLLQGEEIESIIPGLLTICIELAARFCSDAYEDCYFGWDAARFASRREHNLVRSRGQLALARSVADNRRQLEAIARRALK